MTTIIIAEAGVNHNGSVKLAKQMIEEAAKAGADYIKFQTFKPEKLVSKYAQKADYQKKTTGSQESQLQMLEKLALSYDDFVELKKYCEQIGIGFLSTPFDEDSIRFLDRLDMERKSWFLNMRRKQIIRRKRQAVRNLSYRCWKNWHCHMMILWN